MEEIFFVHDTILEQPEFSNQPFDQPNPICRFCYVENESLESKLGIYDVFMRPRRKQLDLGQM